MNTLDARRRLLGRNVYKRTTEGNPAIAQGSLARMYPGITMQGWTEQASTTGAQLFDASGLPTKSVGSVTVTNNGDGSFTVNGSGEIIKTYSNNLYIPYESYIKLKEGTLTLSCDRTIPYFFFQLQDENHSVILNINSTRDAQKTAEITQDILQRVNRVIIGFHSAAGESIEPGTIKPMVYQDGDGMWEPYTGGAPSPSPDYPQEIVSAGNWNEEVQKWEYEITIANEQTDPDKNQTVTLTSDRPLTKWDKLEKRNGQWGWVYKSAEYTMTGEEIFYVASESYIGELTSDSYINVNNLQEINGYYGFSNYLKIYVGVWNGNFDGVEGFSYNGTQIHVRISNEDTGVVAEDTRGKVGDKIKAYCAQRYADGTPFIFWHETTEETFVPLSESEQEAMNAIYTFRPTTVLSNDCECNMSLTYKTKKSIGGGV